jgi:glycosyltransferase involved in cell wall biosynthesis
MPQDAKNSAALVRNPAAVTPERVVVMSDTAYRRLVGGYDVDPAVVRVIPHGAGPGLGGPSLVCGVRPLVLTWGLIRPGKGLELAIEAFASLKDLDPLPRYVVLGRTHPKVLASRGDEYRDWLIGRVHELGLGGIVEFDDRYLDVDALAVVVRGAHVVVLPYESTEQVTSGVLAEAVAAGKPVIATAFPHAVELLGTGAGIVVPHGDPVALAVALRQVLTDPARAVAMTAEARRIAASLYWPAVADRYHRMAAKLAARQASRPAAGDPSAKEALGAVAATD